MPVLFMDLDRRGRGGDLPPTCAPGEYDVGIDSFIDGELDADSTMLEMSMIRNWYDSETSFASAIFLWNASLHESPLLNCVTPSDEYVYMIVKVAVRLSHPAPIDLYLRKRICVRIVSRTAPRFDVDNNNNSSLSSYLWRKLNISRIGETLGATAAASDEPLRATGVTYETVASIPKV